MSRYFFAHLLALTLLNLIHMPGAHADSLNGGERDDVFVIAQLEQDSVVRGGGGNDLLLLLGESSQFEIRETDNGKVYKQISTGFSIDVQSVEEVVFLATMPEIQAELKKRAEGKSVLFN